VKVTVSFTGTKPVEISTGNFVVVTVIIELEA